jgi:DNA-binding MurR/RpiR family transcriptional regulator
LLETTSRAADTGARLIAITDGRLSPLADRAEITFVIAARGVGPFDSAVGAMSLVHALVAAVAARLRRSATGRLDAVEDAWRAGTDLVEQ